jgi:hypothetical protein
MENLSEKANEMFFDKFQKDLKSDDHVTVVLRGHLYIDSLLTAILENFSMYPDELDFDGMPFNRKVKLCKAFGLVHPGIIPSINKLASIRNRFAHQLWATYKESEEVDFINVIKSCKLLLPIFTAAHQSWLDKKMALAVLVLWTGLNRQLGKNLENKKYLAQFWEKVIDATNVDISNVDLKYMDTPSIS